MDELLQGLAARYDFIVIDTPPVLATNDVMSLAPRADGVFVVVRAFYTSSRMLREALERLHRCNVNILGLVYNRAAQSTDYYCRYSRDYHSRSGSHERARLLPGGIPDAGEKSAG
jgi:Mrp family chromosome partitioning ATPase